MYLTDAPTYSASEKITYSYTDVTGSSGYGLTGCIRMKDYNSDTTWSTDNTLSYSYDTLGKLEQASEYNGQKIIYEYSTTTDKMDSVSSYFSTSLYSEITYNFDNKKTTITDETGEYIINKFDDYGHTVNITDSHGTSQSFSYLNLFKYNDNSTNEILYLLDGDPNYNNNHKLVSKSTPQVAQRNYLANAEFEYSFTDPYDGWSNIYLESGSNGILSRVSSSPVAKVGTYSAKISATNDYGAYITQNITLDAGTYTLSGYIYNATSNVEDVYIDAISTTGTYGTSKGSVHTLNEWEFVSKYIVVEADDTVVTIKLANYGIGYGCFDGIQISEGFGTSRINLVENSSFEYASSSTVIPKWGTLGTNVSRVVNTYDSDIYESILGDYGIKMTGSSTVARSVTHTNYSFLGFYDEPGNLLIGGWAKSEGTPTSKQSTDYYDRYFRIQVETTNSFAETNEIYIDFDTSIEGWQYNFGSVPIDDTIVSIDITLEYQGEGDVYFDNISMRYERTFTTYEYDSAGRIEKIIKPSQQETVITYDDDNADDDFTRTPYTITTDGFVTDVDSTIDVINSTITNNILITPSYNDYGQSYSITIGEGTSNYYTTSTAYLASSYYQYTSSTTDKFGKTTTYYSDVYTGLLEAMENAKGQDTHYLYDDTGELAEVQSTEEYDNTMSIIDGKVAYLYDNQNRLIKICLEYNDPNSPTYYYEISYDPEGRMDEVLVNTSSFMTYVYDDGPTYYSNRISTQTYSNGYSMKFEYNDLNQVTETQFLDSEDNYVTRFSYEYSNEGYLNVYTELDDSTIVHREFYSYDSLGRITKIIDEDENIIVYGYDEMSNVSSLYFKLNDMENEISYLYDDEYRISETSYISIASNLLSREYDYTEATALDRLNNIMLHIDNATEELYTEHFVYQGYTSRVTDITYDILSDSSENIKFSYLYDDIGNIIQITYYEDTTQIRKDNYEYDDLNQLIVEDIYYSDTAVDDYTNVYEYDQMGNRTKLSRYGYQRDGLDSPTYELEYTYNSSWSDQLSSYYTMENGVSTSHALTYDNNGNPTFISNFKYSGTVYYGAYLAWSGRELNRISIMAGSSTPVFKIIYKYNDNGYRTSKEFYTYQGYTPVLTETIDYELLGSRVVYETNGIYDILYTYDCNGTLISFNEDGEDYFYLYNLQGDVIGLIDDLGNTIATYSYDAYGNTSITGVSNNPYTYRGYRYDSEIDMYYLNSRYYNPQIGRFINADGIVSLSASVNTSNMYVYCQNNSVTLIDPTGYTQAVGGGGGYGNDEPTGYWDAINIFYEHTHFIYSGYGAAIPYQEFGDSTYPNCYGYALMTYMDDHKRQPGESSSGGISCDDAGTISLVAQKMYDDFKVLNRGIRPILGPNSDIYSYEYRIALRVDNTGRVYRGELCYDYHFMVQTSSGQWAHKQGNGPSDILAYGINPNTVDWGRYNSEILYFAITRP